LVSAHILRHTFAISLMQGAAVAVAFDILSFVLISGLTQGSA
jgi:site-specific recombinase XerD